VGLVIGHFLERVTIGLLIGLVIGLFVASLIGGRKKKSS
jgi:uncharacterized protein YqgC (DUF456 family)